MKYVILSNILFIDHLILLNMLCFQLCLLIKDIILTDFSL